MMQEAEEIGGPEGDEYLRLMRSISEDAMKRIRNFESMRRQAFLEFMRDERLWVAARAYVNDLVERRDDVYDAYVGMNGGTDWVQTEEWFTLPAGIPARFERIAYVAWFTLVLNWLQALHPSIMGPAWYLNEIRQYRRPESEASS